MNRELNRTVVALAELFACVALAGCGGATRVSFPAETVNEAVQQICKDLYKLDVVAESSDAALGVLFYAPYLVDPNGEFDKEFVSDALLNLNTTVMRVALSTDKTFDFVVVVLRGKDDENQIRIIRNVVDIKKSQTDALSIEIGRAHV